MRKYCQNCTFYEIETSGGKTIYDWCMWYGVHIPTNRFYLCSHWEKKPKGEPVKVNAHKRIINYLRD